MTRPRLSGRRRLFRRSVTRVEGVVAGARAKADIRADSRRDGEREHVTLSLRIDRQSQRGQRVGSDPRDREHRGQKDRVAEVVHRRVGAVILRAQPVATAEVQGRGLDRPGVDHRVADEDIAARRSRDVDARGERPSGGRPS